MRLRWHLDATKDPTFERFHGDDGAPLEGTLPPGWERITVQISSDGGLRLFELEPADVDAALAFFRSNPTCVTLNVRNTESGLPAPHVGEAHAVRAPGCMFTG